MRLRQLLLTSLIVSTILVGCDNSHHGRRHSRRHHRKENIKVYHVHDGYCYYNSSNMMWYWLMMSSGTTNNFYSGTLSSNSLAPVGCSWQPVTTASGTLLQPTQEEIAVADVVNETIVVDDRGCPEVDADGNLVDPDSIAPDSPYDTPDTPDNSDGGGMDSGAGDSLGGGDGGSSGGDGGGGD